MPNGVLFPPDCFPPLPDLGLAPVPLAALRSEILHVAAHWQELQRTRPRLPLWAVQSDGSFVPLTPLAQVRWSGRPPVIPEGFVGLAVGFPAQRTGVPCGYEYQQRGINPVLGIACQIETGGCTELGMVISFGQPAREAAEWLVERHDMPRLGSGRWRRPFAAEIIGRLADHVARYPSTGWGNRSGDLKLLASRLSEGKEAPLRWVHDTA